MTNYLKSRITRLVVNGLDLTPKQNVEFIWHVKPEKKGPIGWCKRCGHYTLYGICQDEKCGFLIKCCVCRKIKISDKIWENKNHKNMNDSHTYCPECIKLHYPDIYQEIKK